MEIVSSGKDEGVAVGGAANGLAKVTDPRVIFRGRVIQEHKGILQVLVLDGREDISSVGSRGTGKNFRFGFIKVDTKRWAEFNKEVEEEGEVFVREEGASVIDERGGCGVGSKAIVSEITSCLRCVLRGRRSWRRTKQVSATERGSPWGSLLLAQSSRGCHRVGRSSSTLRRST
jgi:hypothetical protein